MSLSCLPALLFMGGRRAAVSKNVTFPQGQGYRHLGGEQSRSAEVEGREWSGRVFPESAQGLGDRSPKGRGRC